MHSVCTRRSPPQWTSPVHRLLWYKMLVRDNPRGKPSGSDKRTNVSSGERQREDISLICEYTTTKSILTQLCMIASR